MGQASGGSDGGQSNIPRDVEYTSCVGKNQIRKEVIMLDYEPTGVDPYEDDLEGDDLPGWVYALSLAVVSVICLVTAPIAWVKR